MHRVPLTILFIIALLWGVVVFALDAFHGHLFSLIPCLGLVAGIYFVSWAFMLLFRLEWKQQGSIRATLNMVANVGALFLDLENRDREKYTRLMRLLILPPAKFQEQMRSFSL